MPAVITICDLCEVIAAALAAKDSGGTPFSRRIQASENIAGVLQTTPKGVKDAGVQVVVAPKEFDGERVGRGAYQDDHSVDVFFQAMVDTSTVDAKKADVKTLVALMAEVLQWIRPQHFVVEPTTFSLMIAEIKPLYDVQKLTEGIFRSSIVCTYRVIG